MTEFDPEELVDRLMGNESLARRVAGAFIDTMPQQLAALAEAIRNADSPAARMAAHSIKGAAANVGGTAVRDAAQELEKLGADGEFETAARVLPELTASFQTLEPVLRQFRDGKT
jgi:HPt (histidine-containing phosphotransfer) domain-containing protein